MLGNPNEGTEPGKSVTATCSALHDCSSWARSAVWSSQYTAWPQAGETTENHYLLLLPAQFGEENDAVQSWSWSPLTQGSRVQIKKICNLFSSCYLDQVWTLLHAHSSITHLSPARDIWTKCGLYLHAQSIIPSSLPTRIPCTPCLTCVVTACQTHSQGQVLDMVLPVPSSET